MNKNKIALTAAAVLFTGTAGILGVQYVQQENANDEDPVNVDGGETTGTTNNTDEPDIDINQIDTSDWLYYKSEELGIEFKYPGNLRLSENIYGVRVQSLERLDYIIDFKPNEFVEIYNNASQSSKSPKNNTLSSLKIMDSIYPANEYIQGEGGLNESENCSNSYFTHYYYSELKNGTVVSIGLRDYIDCTDAGVQVPLKTSQEKIDEALLILSELNILDSLVF